MNNVSNLLKQTNMQARDGFYYLNDLLRSWDDKEDPKKIDTWRIIAKCIIPGTTIYVFGIPLDNNSIQNAGFIELKQ